MRLSLIAALCVLAAGCATQRAPFSPPEVSEAPLDLHRIAPEYRRTFDVRGVDPSWEGQIALGEAWLRVNEGPLIRIPLLTPTICFVEGCEGVFIEQRVSHRHMGASVIRGDCRLSGSDVVYPYSVSISVLRGPLDHSGTAYKGCGQPAV